MVFSDDTRGSLAWGADLINTLPGMASDPTDRLVTTKELRDFLTAHPYSGAVRLDAAERDAVRAIRPRLRAFWTVDRDGAAELVNEMLAEARAVPQLVRHDQYDWHIHATPGDAPLATRMLVETAMAIVDVIRADEYERLRVCEADDCEAVYVDYSRNRSKRYCDTGNCGNRMNVNAYRRRRAEGTA
ncbi:MAG: CGNR zinc finger domain-containing protein [Microbacterium sp.]|uniref:CGNR zinc finger domain-containing protein n=1 Tax=Microbacterium sp. TaxID=51671 RepID=UPI002631EB12|nr:CGNR zinc finger domain-containing protein [Microbacterium sp.]MCX6502392.1 CGNR zinc finger domain-containing protein [Microbacterium sp.]